MERVDRLTKRLRQRRAVGGRRRRRGEEEVEVAGSDEVEETKRLEIRALKIRLLDIRALKLRRQEFARLTGPGEI